MNRASAALLLFTMFCFAQAPQRNHSAKEYPDPLIREDQNVEVEGILETWRLQWKTPPELQCGPDEGDGALTCPCDGFAYGESGDLDLVRLRDGKEVDRLRLTPFFGQVFSRIEQKSAAIVQRSSADYKRDFKLSQRDGFAKLISKRPTVQVMHFADYDHDKKATEFYIQTEAAPCGKSIGVVVGLSETNPRLHVFGSVSNPSKPLYLQKFQWDAIRQNSTGSTTIVDWRCFDHGSETQSELLLRWNAQGIDGVRREYTCPSGKQERRLISERPL